MKPTRASLMAKLMRNALHYRLCRLTGRAAPIQAISLEVTHRCMSRCVMCNIWRIPPQVKDLTVENWVGLLDSASLSGLREIDITGGEPFLRADLPDLVGSIVDLKKSHLTELRGIAVTTNGFLTRRILTMTRRMADALGSEGLDLVLVCAMDAVGELHDRIRRVKHGWRKLDATIGGLCKLRETYGNIVLGLKTTILPDTVGHLEAISNYADSRSLFTIVSPCILTSNRYDNLELREDLDFSNRDREKLVGFFESSRFRWDYHRAVVLDYLHGRRVTKPCTAGFNYFFVRSTGEVFPCPLIPYSIGNFTEAPIEDLVQSDRAAKFRRSSLSYDECNTCTEPGLERYALPFEGITYAGLMLTMERDKFSQFHAHMGLDKYIA